MQDQDNQKNLLLAIVLSVSILLAWQLMFAGPKLKEEQERRARVQQEQTQTSQPGGAPKTGTETLPKSTGGALPSSISTPAASSTVTFPESSAVTQTSRPFGVTSIPIWAPGAGTVATLSRSRSMTLTARASRWGG